MSRLSHKSIETPIEEHLFYYPFLQFDASKCLLLEEKSKNSFDLYFILIFLQNLLAVQF